MNKLIEDNMNQKDKFLKSIEGISDDKIVSKIIEFIMDKCFKLEQVTHLINNVIYNTPNEKEFQKSINSCKTSKVNFLLETIDFIVQQGTTDSSVLPMAVLMTAIPSIGTLTPAPEDTRNMCQQILEEASKELSPIQMTILFCGPG